jgi:hypothetical protein
MNMRGTEIDLEVEKIVLHFFLLALINSAWSQVFI